MIARRPRALVGLVLVLLAASPGPARALGTAGLETSTSSAATFAGFLPERREDEPERLVLRIVMEPAEPGTGWDSQADTLGQPIRTAAERASVIVALPPGVPRASDTTALDAWLEAITALVAKFAGRVDAWEVPAPITGDGIDPAGVAKEHAFVVKRASLAIKAGDPSADVVMALAAGQGPLRELLDSEGATPFVVATSIEAEKGDAAVVPGTWLHGLRARPDRAWEELAWAPVRGGAVTTIAIEGRAEALDAGAMRRALETFVRAYPEDIALLPTEGSPVRAPSEVPLRQALHVVGSDLSSRLTFLPVVQGQLPGSAMILRIEGGAANARLFDPEARGEVRLEQAMEGNVLAVQVPLVRRTLVLAWDRVAPEGEITEDQGIAGEVVPTVEEILARHFQVQAVRDEALDHYTADLVTTMRYELGRSGQDVEVRIEGRYFHDADGVREIENQRFFINGARYEPRKGKPPEIPLLEPEKVTVLPLDIHLDRTYSYRLDGRTQRLGRPAWKVAFEPTTPGENAVSGHVFIDAETWDRLEVRQVTRDPQPPILSNEQADRYRKGPGGTWLVHRSDIHRSLSVLGSNVLVEIQSVFSGHVVNGGDFEAQLAQAHASPHQMMRDTEEGMRYLRTGPDGQRVEAVGSSRKTFFIAGARHDASYGGVIPLAGFNWLDHDFRGSGLQIDLFVAGAINSVSIADPSLFGSRRWGLSLDSFIPFIRQSDRLRLPETGIEDGHIVRVHQPDVDVEVFRTLGTSGRLGAFFSLGHEGWGEHDDTDDDFEPPSNTFVGAFGLSGELNRRGWSWASQARVHRRGSWEAWGPVVAGEPTIESPETFLKWRTGISKTWNVGAWQDVGFQADVFSGSDLDRFSQHEFTSFGGPSLPGFDGTGIHFDDAGIVKLSWGFNVAGLFGIDLTLGAARVRNRSSLPDAVVDEFGRESTHVGLGIAGQTPGPWGTLIRFDVGAPVRSRDFHDVEGDLVAQVLFLKLLK